MPRCRCALHEVLKFHHTFEAQGQKQPPASCVFSYISLRGNGNNKRFSVARKRANAGFQGARPPLVDADSPDGTTEPSDKNICQIGAAGVLPCKTFVRGGVSAPCPERWGMPRHLVPGCLDEVASSRQSKDLPAVRRYDQPVSCAATQGTLPLTCPIPPHWAWSESPSRPTADTTSCRSSRPPFETSSSDRA
jgi:hypothetical protein